MKTFKTYLNEVQQLWYHGRTVKSSNFDLKYTGKGNNQDGPGFYFTTIKMDGGASAYSGNGGIIITAELNPKKMVTGKPNTKEAIKLMKAAPDLEDVLTDWAENPVEAFNNALEAMMNTDTKIDMFENIWYDFYRTEGPEFLKQMIKMGYDGHVARRMNNVMVMYNPKAIKIIQVDNYEDI